MINKASYALLITLASLQGCNSDSSVEQATEETPSDTIETTLEVAFVSVPGNDVIADFEMGKTEVTNEQYVDFLNKAYADGIISYNDSEMMVYDLDQNPMIFLGGTRVVKDHNGDGTFALDEMENPLNRSFIAFNSDTVLFEVVDPLNVDWHIYFDDSLFPNVVDSISDWAELNDEGTGFYGEGDQDKQLPSLDEVKTWSVSFVRYYGAQAFANYYNFDLPTKEQWQFAGKGGQDFEYATSDGTADEGIAWFSIDAPFAIHKGHVQPALSKEPNPYGLYNLGGGLWEWCQDWYDGYAVFGGDPKVDEDFFIDESISYAESENTYLKCLLGGSFNYFGLTLSVTWNHAAIPVVANDHFGFRVVKNQ